VFVKNDKVEFIGYPSYKRGLKGVVTYVADPSKSDSDAVRVDFKNGTWIMTDPCHIRKLEKEL
jgi:hypothetical protein